MGDAMHGVERQALADLGEILAGVVGVEAVRREGERRAAARLAGDASGGSAA
jgi:hypothetical protein